MPYFNTCPHCGSNLDPGESCDCKEQRGTQHEQSQTNLCSQLHNKHFDKGKAHCPPDQR